MSLLERTPSALSSPLVARLSIYFLPYFAVENLPQERILALARLNGSPFIDLKGHKASRNTHTHVAEPCARGRNATLFRNLWTRVLSIFGSLESRSHWMNDNKKPPDEKGSVYAPFCAVRPVENIGLVVFGWQELFCVSMIKIVFASRMGGRSVWLALFYLFRLAKFAPPPSVPLR